MFSFRITILISCLVLVYVTAKTPLRADVIWIKGQSEPVYGWIVAADEQQVVFRSTDVGLAQPLKFERDLIESFVKNIDASRLEKLDPADLPAYRDYAEELSIQKVDPVARALAIRLYLIAAAHGPQDLQQSSLRGMVALANNDKQLKKWSLLLRLTQSSRDQTTGEEAQAGQRIEPADQQLALRIVRSIRQGQGSEATQLLLQPEVRSSLRHWNPICAVDELNKMASLNRPTLSQLNKLLQIELSIINDESQAEVDGRNNAENWGESAQASPMLTGLIPSFENATEFDPAKSIYRAGRWVEPN